MPTACVAKVGHRNKRAAREQIAGLIVARKAGRGLVAYKCSECPRWHVGHEANATLAAFAELDALKGTGT